MKIKYNSDRHRNVMLDLIRGVAILIVVVGHAIQVNTVDSYSCFIWSKLISAFQMPLLFAISGYTLGFSFPSSDPNKFIRKKVRRLLIPYITWEIIHYIIVEEFLSSHREFSIVDFVKKIFISDFWFLRMLFLFFLIVWLFDLILHSFHFTKNKTAAILLLVSGGILVFFLQRVDFMSYSISLWYYLWFVGGYILFEVMKNRKLDKLCRNPLIRGLAVGIAIALMIVITIVLKICTLPSEIVTIVFTIGVPATIYTIKPIIPRKIQNGLIELGKNTLPVYAIHWCILFSPLLHSGFYMKCFSKFPLIISSVITTVAWILFCIILIKVLRMNRITNSLLLGEK